MRIVADADILSVEESFAELGELVLVPGRQISNQHLSGADALLVRSITPVNEALLSGTSVRFVGTATSGIDHIDTEFLRRHRIRFCHARGANANAVVDYCFTAMALLSSNMGFDPYAKQFALLGAGHVGGLFARKLAALGIQCMVHDPLLDDGARSALIEQGIRMANLEEALAAEVISLHVPLTRNGQHPTFHLLGARELESLPADGILLNTSRGAVLDNSQLAQVLTRRSDLAVVLDVWENEPEIDQSLLKQVTVGTPHIAGYSVEAKLNATISLRNQLCEFFALSRQSMPDLSGTSGWEAASIQTADVDTSDRFCASVLLSAFPLTNLDRQLRERLSPEAATGGFDALRRELTQRREFVSWQVQQNHLTEQQQKFLQVLGFRLTRH